MGFDGCLSSRCHRWLSVSDRLLVVFGNVRLHNTLTGSRTARGEGALQMFVCGFHCLPPALPVSHTSPLQTQRSTLASLTASKARRLMELNPLHLSIMGTEPSCRASQPRRRRRIGTRPPTAPSRSQTGVRQPAAAPTSRGRGGTPRQGTNGRLGTFPYARPSGIPSD